MWLDLFGYAALAEGMEIGTWTCMDVSPASEAGCLSESLIEAVGDWDVAKARRARAREIGERVRAGEPGRDPAARVIAGLARLH